MATDEEFNPRDLWTPKLPEVKKRCASCPFLEDNDAEFETLVKKLAAHNGEHIRPELVSLHVKVARERIEKDADEMGDFACHSTVYNEDMSLKPREQWQQCKGATEWHKRSK